MLRGQHWCLFGGNGAGKSLLASIIRGRLTLARSHVSYAVDFKPDHDIQVVSFEEQQRLWQLDARHDVNEFNVSASDVGTTVARLVADNHGNDTTLEDILKLLGIVDLASRGIRFTSSGQVRHAMIARALFQCPQLLILD